ncbi:MAG: tetratricopeptide repeat protein [Bacteroidales bacterium]|nr:tetratricopeptide repeat protein [Bacteroidales bacterium]
MTWLDFADELTVKIAEYFFDKNHYEQAMPVYTYLLQTEDNSEWAEKLGYCYQQTGQYSKAIECYGKSEFYNPEKVWLQKKLAYCFKKNRAI